MSNPREYDLAIVIPAYKAKFLDIAITSIANQSSKNFKLYISDDGSKENLKAIADKYANQLDISYVRFDENVGRYDLVKHWNRSVRLAKEKWIWLFSDDDIMSPGCVKAFFDALAVTSSQYNLYRFSIEMIDENGQIIIPKTADPVTENAYSFLTRRLRLQCLSAAVEYIFKKEIFEKNEGFVNFPLAYCSDDASWIEFSDTNDIYTIASETISWRASGINISSAVGLQNQKAHALLQFINYILKRFPDKKDELLLLSETWFFNSLDFIKPTLSWSQWVSVLRSLSKIFPNRKRLLKRAVKARLKNTRLSGVSDSWLKV